MACRIFHSAAFVTPAAFSGNPACVVLDSTAAGLTDVVMMQLAAEMNLSETAFLRPLLNSTAPVPPDPFATCSAFQLRWFTPTTEVPLCGHATLASANALFELGNSNDYLHFSTLSGELGVSKLADGALSMRFPCNVPHRVCDWRKLDHISAIVAAAVGDDADVHSVWLDSNTKKLVIRLPSWVDFSPNAAAMLAVDQSHAAPHMVVRGVSVTAQGSDGADFFSRYFSPWNGISEDPVNGSSHTVLGPLWAANIVSAAASDAEPFTYMPSPSSSAEGAALVLPEFCRLRAVQMSRRRGVLDVTVVSKKSDGGHISQYVLLAGRVRSLLAGTLRALPV